ncbi:MAG: hypothetical protein Q9163_003916 [Psora crenata]
MGFFSKAFKSKDSNASPKPKAKKTQAHTNGAVPAPPPKPHWDDAWTRKDVEPEEIQELLRGCTHELKSRALDMPFLLLPFRPASDPSAARTFIRNYFSIEKGAHLVGERLEQELMLTEPMVLSSVLKWCWSRLAGGVVTWEAYELFRVGEQDSSMARDAFATFIPLSVESDARTKIIFDFFDLLSAIAAHGKTNGMGGRKLSRLAGWWAFDQSDDKNGFDGGYRAWSRAADATSHLFFAYLRSLSPGSVKGINGISALPLSLQTLVQETRYPPEHPPYQSTSKVVMVVDSVSPTPFALLRRAKNFAYREDDRLLQAFSNFEDPVQALSDECRRVLKCISSINERNVSTINSSTSLGDASWSRFEDIGFGAIGEFDDDQPESVLGRKQRRPPQGIHSAPQTKSNGLGRPTTPSWADFLSSGFVDEPSSPGPAPLLLPPDKILPPIELDRRGQSSQSHVRPTDESELGPGELASINAVDLDDAFWWVWITSLAGEETPQRKAVFGRCALIETTIEGAWLVIEEMVKGAAPEPEVGAYIAEKKSRFTFGKRRNMSKTKAFRGNPRAPVTEPFARNSQASPMSKTSIGPDQHARIQAAAAALQKKQKHPDSDPANMASRRARTGDSVSTKTNSVFTLQPVIMSEAAPAMKWANSYDKTAIRAAYLGDDFAGKGSATDRAGFGPTTHDSITPRPLPLAKDAPAQDYGFPKTETKNENLPALPMETPGERMQASTSPISPPPLPVEPDRQPANQAAADAADVPLPTPEGEPLEQTETLTGKQNGLSPGSSPESKRGGNKLRKKEARNFKGMFKKKGLPPAPSGPADPLAAAAARAALTSKSQAQPAPSLSRRFSRIGRKDDSGASTPQPMPQTQQQLAPPAPFKSDYGSRLSLGRADSNEFRAADNARLSKPNLTQGPVDGPGFLPKGSPHPSFVPESSNVSRPSTAEPVGAHYDPPITKGGEYEPSVSSEGDRPPSPAQDRWAQIRKNAAERAGRAAEEQATAGQSSAESKEEGEDSGEETIESRVARIKARVAELTGNMQGQDTAARP